MRIITLLSLVESASSNDVKIDNVNGLGAVPHNQDVDYFGMRVKMKPSTFLSLAVTAKLKQDNYVIRHIRSGGSIGSPFLEIEVPKQWWDDDFSLTANVVGHEGRHRMAAVKDSWGDIPIETHLFFGGGIRARHLTDEIKQNINRGMFKEGSSNTFIRGPLFDMIK